MAISQKSFARTSARLSARASSGAAAGASASAAALRSLLSGPDRPGPVMSAMARLEATERLDPLLKPLRKAVQALPLGDTARDALHGRWLGHPAHPMMVQFPIGTWLSAGILDMMPRRGGTAGLLIGAGLAGALPSAVAGWVDWADMRPHQQRVGLVHAATNTLAVGLYATSLGHRLRGQAVRGRAYAYAGLAAVVVGGAIGGHLSYRQAAAVNHAEDIQARTEPGWHPLGDIADLPVGQPVRRTVGGTPVVVVRESGEQVHVLADRCSHDAGPLSQGEVADGCVRCPWHGSVFRLSDGWNVQGPATAPQPSFETRSVDGGRLEARLRS